MEQIDKAVKVVQTLAGNFGSMELQAAQQKMSALQVGEQMIKQIKVPILTNDENVKEFVKKFDLQNPENMIRFFVEANFAAIESVKESINELKVEMLNETIAKVDAAKDHIADAIENDEDAKNELEEAKNLLDLAINELIPKIKTNINGIREIDNRSGWQFFLKSKVSIKDIDTYVCCAEVALRSLVAAVEAERQITAIKRKTKEPESVIKCSRFIKTQILDGDACSLMHAYDKDKKDKFWLRIEQVCAGIIGNNCLAEYVDEYDDIDFS